MTDKQLNNLEMYVHAAEKRIREIRKIINVFRLYNQLKDKQ